MSAHTHPVDQAVERLARWTASRTSRRTFLARIGKVAAMLAVGPALASMIASRRADARVCGQSGVSNKCSTYDCVGEGNVWGFCWYARGCCADGGLKKICDCCGRDFPNVHGYCPAGHNVFCIVESCHGDPRVMSVPVARVVLPADARGSAQWSGLVYPAGGAPRVVLGSSADQRFPAMLAPHASRARVPLLLTDPTRLTPAVIAELQRLGATSAEVWGAFAPRVLEDLARYVRVDRAVTTDDDTAFSVQVARVMQGFAQPGGAFAVANTGDGAQFMSIASAAATTLGWPLLVGLDAVREVQFSARPVNEVWMLGGDLAASANGIPGAQALSGAPRDVSIAVARVVLDRRADRVGFGVRSVSTIITSTLMSELGPILVHADGGLDEEIRQFARGVRDRTDRVSVIEGPGRLSDEGLWALQSDFNHFDNQRLIGVSGEGLPVIEQPGNEIPIGNARILGEPVEGPRAGIWISRANPARQ